VIPFFKAIKTQPAALRHVAGHNFIVILSWPILAVTIHVPDIIILVLPIRNYDHSFLNIHVSESSIALLKRGNMTHSRVAVLTLDDIRLTAEAEVEKEQASFRHLLAESVCG